MSCSNVPVLPKHSANKNVSRDPDNGRSTLSVDKKDETNEYQSQKYRAAPIKPVYIGK